MFCMLKKKKCPAYVSKPNSSSEKQVIFLMIPNGEGRHYITVKKSPALLRGITTKHHGDFCCLNCLHFSAAEEKRKSNKRLCENKDF